MEGNKKTKPRAILVFGAPCSGKTTFCEKFSRRFKAPYYNLQTLREEADFTEKQIHVVLEAVSKTGQNIVIEGGLDTEAERNAMCKLLKLCGYNPSLIWIQTDINTIKTRLKAKLKSAARAKEEYDTRIKAMEAPAESEKPIILSGKHTFDTQIKQVLSQLP
ncbi:MAG: AAA family ATPase [Candidatus Saccharibacteria bacterium]|nr:AAA family ATPase [Candidatus Saccharibacteria bacterium]